MDDRSVIDQLDDVWSALRELAHGLTPEEWGAPTDCPGWSVQDHVSHVVGTESALLGRPPPPPAPPAPHVRNPLGEANETWVVQRRPRPGAEVAAELDEVTAARLSALRSMSDEEMGTPHPSPIGPVPYRTFMSVRVMDCWVHEQDIRQAIGRPWRFDGPAAPAAVERLDAAFGYVVGKKTGPPDGSVVVLVVEGPLERRLAVTMRGGRAVPTDDAGSPAVVITTESATQVRLATGRLSAADALSSGAVHIAGDRRLGERVLANLAQMP